MQIKKLLLLIFLCSTINIQAAEQSSENPSPLPSLSDLNLLMIQHMRRPSLESAKKIIETMEKVEEYHQKATETFPPKRIVNLHRFIVRLEKRK